MSDSVILKELVALILGLKTIPIVVNGEVERFYSTYEVEFLKEYALKIKGNVPHSGE
jgi:hypothetical protein